MRKEYDLETLKVKRRDMLPGLKGQSPDFDPEGVAIAVHRDQEIESGAVHPISHTEFMRRIAYPAS